MRAHTEQRISMTTKPQVDKTHFYPTKKKQGKNPGRADSIEIVAIQSHWHAVKLVYRRVSDAGPMIGF